MKASNIVEIARGEVGYIGKAHSYDDVTVKEAPNGAGKFNKYSRELNLESYYNSPKDGADWCCILVDWLAYKAAGSDKAAAIKCKPLAGGGCGAGVYWAHEAYQQSQRGTVPTVGAQVFYKDKDGFAHTGLVVSVNADNSFDTVEGNWGNAVVLRKGIKFGEYYSGQYVFDFGYPAYDAEAAKLPQQDAAQENANEQAEKATESKGEAVAELTARNQELRDEMEDLRKCLEIAEENAKSWEEEAENYREKAEAYDKIVSAAKILYDNIGL